MHAHKLISKSEQVLAVIQWALPLIVQIALRPCLKQLKMQFSMMQPSMEPWDPSLNPKQAFYLSNRKQEEMRMISLKSFAAALEKTMGSHPYAAGRQVPVLKPAKRAQFIKALMASKSFEVTTCGELSRILGPK